MIRIGGPANSGNERISYWSESPGVKQGFANKSLAKLQTNPLNLDN